MRNHRLRKEVAAMVTRVWQGRTEEIPDEYRNPMRDRWIPEDCEFTVIMNDGSRIYHHGLNPTEEQGRELNRVISRCWDKMQLL